MAEARDAVRAHGQPSCGAPDALMPSRSSSAGLQELVPEPPAAAGTTPSMSAPRAPTLLSDLVESKLVEHQRKKLDAVIQAEWEVVDTADEEEYVML